MSTLYYDVFSPHLNVFHYIKEACMFYSGFFAGLRSFIILVALIQCILLTALTLLIHIREIMMIIIHHKSTTPITDIVSINKRLTIPKEKVLVQKLPCAYVGQWEDLVDSHKQSGVHRNKLQPLKARRPAGQSLRARLLQPVNVRLEAKERTFREIEEGDYGIKKALRRQ